MCVIDRHMDRSPVLSHDPPSVRLPFRILAALVFIAGVAAVAGESFLAWRHELGPGHLQDLYWIPGALWLVRHGYYAMRYGRAATPSGWPFASERLVTLYLLVGVFVLRA